MRKTTQYGILSPINHGDSFVTWKRNQYNFNNSVFLF